jgi:hypothetical protein
VSRPAAPPIPETFWFRITAFIEAERTGSLTLHVHRGAVGALEVREVLRLRNLVDVPALDADRAGG